MSCDCRRMHDGSICLCACHLTYQGRDGREILDSDTVADLCIIGARRSQAAKLVGLALDKGRDSSRIGMMYADDLQPLTRNGKPIPWAVAIAAVTAY